MSEPRIAPPATLAVIGLGRMGLPMSRRLVAAGFAVRGADRAAAAREAFAAAGGRVFAAPREAAAGAVAAITILPDGKAVRDALLGADGAAAALAPGALVIEMSSSAPTDTLALGEALAARGIGMIDAPVSGGVPGAVDGTLAISAGGEPARIERARAILETLGRTIFPTGKLGSAHALKALNNYVSAAGLAAAAEALLLGRAFGVAPGTLVDFLNAASGRNNSTEKKLNQQIVSERFDSGFALALMAKDVRNAADLASHLALDAPFLAATAALWERARASLAEGADHTEIYRFLAQRAAARPAG